MSGVPVFALSASAAAGVVPGAPAKEAVGGSGGPGAGGGTGPAAGSRTSRAETTPVREEEEEEQPPGDATGDAEMEDADAELVALVKDPGDRAKLKAAMAVRAKRLRKA